MMFLAALDATKLEQFKSVFSPAITESLLFFGPEFQLACSILAIFLVDAFLPRRFSRHVAWVALAACITASLSVLAVYNTEPRALFLGMIAIDPFANFFKLFFLLGTVPIILLTYLSRELREMRMGEYYGILLAAVLGAMLMASSNNLLMAFLSLELLSVSSYILVGYRKLERKGSEASLKYIIYGSVAAGVMAYGLSLLYGLTGSADFGSLGQVLDGFRAGAENSTAVRIAVTVALLSTFAGLAFKMAAIPMHFWCPDVYEGAPTAITAFLSVGSKAAGFALGMRFLEALQIVDAEVARSVSWPIILIVISLFTMTLGNFAALWQDNLKRMLAYSSIAHAGYMLMGLVIIPGSEEFPATALVSYYLLAYLAMNLGAFSVVILIESRLGSVDIGAYAGLGRRAPFLAVGLTIFLFSLIGIPPTAGFAGKLQLFGGVLEAAKTGGWPYYVLAVGGVLNTAVSVYYYARIIKNMYLLDPAADGAGMPETGGSVPAVGAGTAGKIRIPLVGTALVAVFLFLTFYLFFQMEQIARATLHLKVF